MPNNINEPKQDKFTTNNTHNNQPNISTIILSIQNHIPIHKIPNNYPAIINKYYRHIHLTTTKSHDLNDKQLSLNNTNEHQPEKFKTYTIHNNQPHILMIICSIQNNNPINKIPYVYLTIINQYYRHINQPTYQKNSKQISYTTINHTF